VDTLAQASAGGNENSGEDMGEVLAACRRIHKETGAMVLLVHHSGKDQTKGERGWSGMRAGMDCSIEVIRNDNQRSFKVSKLKDGEDGQVFLFEQKIVEIGFDEDGDVISSCVVVHSTADFVPPPKTIKPCGKTQIMIYNEILDLEVFDSNVKNTFGSLLVHLASKMDTKNFKRSIKTMVERGVLFESGDVISTKPFVLNSDV
jgi:hypothetical protein